MLDPTVPLPGQIVPVEVKSAWFSKINWTQAISVLAMVLAVTSGGKLNLSVELQLGIVAAITAIQAVVTIVIKTWFTPTVTPQSIPPTTPVLRSPI